MGSILVFAPGTFHHGGNQVGLLLIGGVEVFPRQFVVGILLQMTFTFSNKFVKGAQILAQRGIYGSVACGGLQSGNAKSGPSPEGVATAADSDGEGCKSFTLEGTALDLEFLATTVFDGAVGAGAGVGTGVSPAAGELTCCTGCGATGTGCLVATFG